MATKVYRNTTKQKINIIGIGEIPAGEQVSITSDHLPAVILENYPGVEDITDEVTEPANKKGTKNE